MIKRLRLHNFKSITRIDVELGPLTVLVGRSGTGKTNIVEGLRFWRNYLIGHDWNPFNNKWHAILSATGKEKTFGIDIGFDVPGTRGEFFYSALFNVPSTAQHHPTFASEQLSLNGKVLFEQKPNTWTVTPEVMAPPGAGQLNLGNIYGLPEVGQAFLALTQGIGCYDFPGNVLTPGGPPAAHTTRGLADHAENYIAIFETIHSSLAGPQFREIIAALRQLNPTIATLDLDRQQQQRIHVGHRTASGKALSLELAQQSEGFRRFLAHLLALYQIPSKPTLIFEEAEKGIYPGALAALAEHFKAVADKGESQVIITTHSPQLLDHFPAESIRVVEMEDYQTKVGPLGPDQLEALKQSLLRPGELLTSDPARIAETV